MAVDDEIILEFQGEDSSFSKTTQKALEEINALDSSIQKLISKFNIFSEVSEKAGNSLSNISKASSGIEEMSNHLEKMSKGFESSSTVMEQTKGAMQSLSSGSSTIDKVSSSTSNLDNQVKSLQQQYEELKQRNDSLERSNQSLAASYNKISAVVGLVYKSLKSWTLSAAEATRTQIRFNASFNTTEDELKDMTKWVNEYSNALFLDNIQVEGAISKFRVLTGTMGFNNDKSKQMSKNLTQLAYDLSAISGKDVSETVNQLTSALGGQNKALKDYGISIENAALKETLASHGINRKVDSLSAAEKAEVRYQTIMEKTAGYQGFYAKTMLSPANAANIVKTQFSMLAREIGNVFIPVLMAIVPVVIKITSALRTLAQAIANFFGLKIDFGSYSDGFSLMNEGIGGIGDSADGTSKKVKNMLRDFDDLHVIDFGDDSGSGKGYGAGGGGSDLFDPMDYAETNGLLDGMLEKFKSIEDYIVAIGLALAGWKIASSVLGFFNKLFDWGLTPGEILLKGLGVGLILGGAYLTYKGMKKILDGELTAANILEVLTGNAAIAGGVMALTGGNLRLGIGVALAIDSLFAEFAGMKKLVNGEFSWQNVFQTLGGALGVGVAALIAGASLPIAGGAIILSLAASFAFSSLPSLDEIKDALVTLRDAIVDWWNSTTNVEKFKTLGMLIFDGILVGIGAAILGIPGAILGLFTAIVLAIVTLFDIHSPSKVMIEYGKNIIMGIFEGITSMFGKVTEIFTQLRDMIVAKVIDIKNNVTTKITETKDNVVNKFNEMKTNVISKIDEVKSNVSTKFESIKTKITDTINTARDNVKKAIDKIKGFFNFSWKLPDIKMPHFGIDWDTSGMIGQAFQKLGFPGLPNLRVDWYAQGGFPDKGDLFIANEREPELIGSMGNKSAVANSTQIIEGIAQGSYNAFKKALNEMQEDFGGDTYVYVGDTQLTDIVTKRKRIQDKRFGR